MKIARLVAYYGFCGAFGYVLGRFLTGPVVAKAFEIIVEREEDQELTLGSRVEKYTGPLIFFLRRFYMENYDVKVGQTMDLVNEGLGKYKDLGVSVRFKKGTNEYQFIFLNANDDEIGGYGITDFFFEDEKNTPAEFASGILNSLSVLL